MNRLDLGKFYLTHDKIPANGAWLGPGAKFINFGTACIYLDLVELDTSNFANSCNVASTVRAINTREHVLGRDPFKNCCD